MKRFSKLILFSCCFLSISLQAMVPRLKGEALRIIQQIEPTINRGNLTPGEIRFIEGSFGRLNQIQASSGISGRIDKLYQAFLVLKQQAVPPVPAVIPVVVPVPVGPDPISSEPPQAALDLSVLPEEMLLATIVQGINQAKTLPEAWQFLQNLALTGRQFAALTRDRGVINALANKIINPQEDLFNFVQTKERIGANTAKMIIAAFKKAGADVNKAEGQYGFIPLIVAIRDGQLEMVRGLLVAGADPNQEDQNGITPLIEVAREKDLAMVRELLQAGANPNKANQDGYTPLMAAAAPKGNLAVVQELLRAGADPNQEDKRGSTALIEAAVRGHLEIIRELLRAGVDPHKKDQGSTALRWAASEGSLEMVRDLLQIGVNKNKKDEIGFTPLMWAAFHGHSEVVKELVQAGADINIVDNQGRTVLDIATPEIKELILEAQKKRA